MVFLSFSHLFLSIVHFDMMLLTYARFFPPCLRGRLFKPKKGHPSIGSFTPFQPLHVKIDPFSQREAVNAREKHMLY